MTGKKSIIYLLWHNDLKTITEEQRTLENIQDLEKLPSEEMKKITSTDFSPCLTPSKCTSCEPV